MGSEGGGRRDGVVTSEGGGWTGGGVGSSSCLHSCPRCCVVVPYCPRVVVARRSRMWLSRTINNDERRPLSSFVVCLTHSLLSCSLLSIVIWWSSCHGVVCRGRVSAEMDMAPRSGVDNKGRGTSIDNIDYSPRTKMIMTNDKSFVV